MQVNAEQFPRIDGQIESVFRQGTQTLIGFIGEKRAQLIAQNQDNVVFEAGAMRLRGREDIRAGEYVNLMLGINGGTSSIIAAHNQLTADHNALQAKYAALLTHMDAANVAALGTAHAATYSTGVSAATAPTVGSL